MRKSELWAYITEFPYFFITQVFRKEEQLKKLFVKDLEANLNLMKLNLRTVFSQPRSKSSHPSTRERVGGFIYQKMGRTGILVGMQDFDHKIRIVNAGENLPHDFVSISWNFVLQVFSCFLKDSFMVIYFTVQCLFSQRSLRDTWSSKEPFKTFRT